jgi:hypothetical protein
METKKKKEILNSEYDVNLEENSREEMTKMCNLGQAVYDNGVRDGEARGEANGLTALVYTLKKCMINLDDVYKLVTQNNTYANVTYEEVSKLYKQN